MVELELVTKKGGFPQIIDTQVRVRKRDGRLRSQCLPYPLLSTPYTTTMLEHIYAYSQID